MIYFATGSADTVTSKEWSDICIFVEGKDSMQINFD